MKKVAAKTAAERALSKMEAEQVKMKNGVIIANLTEPFVKGLELGYRACIKDCIALLRDEIRRGKGGGK